MGERMIHVRKIRHSTWRRNATGKWVWRCRSCKIEGALYHSLPEAHDGGIEHLEDEHLEAQPAAS